MTNDDDSLTERLRAYFGGDSEDLDALLREILPKLREIAARELHREHQYVPVCPTELIQEIWLRNLSRASWTIRDRGHFYAIASLAMRRVLMDHARKRLAERRTAESPMPSNGNLAEGPAVKDARQIVEIGLLMDRLEQEFPDLARVVDMHYFAGFTFTEIAANNNLTVRQVRIRWSKAIQWLKAHHRTVSSAGQLRR